jgi:hypothetical protein
LWAKYPIAKTSFQPEGGCHVQRQQQRINGQVSTVTCMDSQVSNMLV